MSGRKILIIAVLFLVSMAAGFFAVDLFDGDTDLELISNYTELPDMPPFTENIEVTTDSPRIADAETFIHTTPSGKRMPVIKVNMHRLGSTTMTVTDGGEVYRYRLTAEKVHENGVTGYETTVDKDD